MRAQVTRRMVDASQLHIRVVHGTVYVQGILRKLRSYPDVDLDQEIETISHALRLQPGIREVIWEASNR
jgi:hypothetical protein